MSTDTPSVEAEADAVDCEYPHIAVMLRALAAERDALKTRVTDLEGERAVLCGILADCASQMEQINPDETWEPERWRGLLIAIGIALVPERRKGELL